MAEKFVHLMDWINRKTLFCAVILFFLAFAMLFAQITARYLLEIPFLIGDEISRYATVWIVYIGAGLAARYNRLIKMEVILSAFPFAEKNKWFFEWFSGAVSVVFYFFVIRYGVQMLGLVQTQVSPVLNLSMSIPYSALPVGSFLMIANTLACLLDKNKAALEQGTLNLEQNAEGGV